MKMVCASFLVWFTEFCDSTILSQVVLYGETVLEIYGVSAIRDVLQIAMALAIRQPHKLS